MVAWYVVERMEAHWDEGTMRCEWLPGGMVKGGCAERKTRVRRERWRVKGGVVCRWCEENGKTRMLKRERKA